MKQTRKAFTMVELIFVIVILGIISSIAISKMAVTRDDAMITKGRSQVSAIRNAIALAKSMKMMQGGAGGLYPTKLDNLAGTGAHTSGSLFDTDGATKLLDYPIYAKNSDGHWTKKSYTASTKKSIYTFHVMKQNIDFSYDATDGSFDCHGLNAGAADTTCKNLTE